MHFAVGTTNTPKSQAIESVLKSSPFTEGAGISFHKVPSGVADMPTTLQELRTGAKNRAIFTRREQPNADFFVGMEGGVYQDREGDEYWLTCVVYVEDRDGVGYFGYSCHLRLPEVIVDGLFDGQGRDLEEVVHALYQEESVGDKEGSFGLFSQGLLPRSEAFSQATKAALVPHFSSFYR